MKTNKNLRTAAAHKMLAVIVLLGVSMYTRVSAQTIVAPVTPDNPVGPVGYPNSSTIDYSNYYCSFSHPQLTAMVADGGIGGPAPTLFLNDHNIPTAWLPAPIPTPPGCSPDVIIGNDMGKCGSYIIAVVATVPCGGGNDVMLYTYSVSGPAPFTAPPVPMATYNLSNTCNVLGPAHIDIIDEHSNLVGASSCTPLALASKFVVTWKDASQGIMGYFANLNFPNNGAPVVINANTSLSCPDVAGIERQSGCDGFEDWALFSYVDLPFNLYYQEWQITPMPAVSAPILYDNTLDYVEYLNPYPQDFISVARIDAIDDYHLNSPTGGNAIFDIVASFVFITGAGEDVVEYNNITGPLVHTDITGVFTPSLTVSNVPQVACGPGANYTVGYTSFGTLLPQNYYATSISWTSGLPTPANTTYQINMSSVGSSPGWQYGVAVSTSSNIDVCAAQQTFAGFESSGALWGKYSSSACVPYAFRSANPAAVTDWQLSPNPTSDNFTIIAPDGFTPNDGTTYAITDLSGKVIKQGKVGSIAELVSVSNLASGMYLVNINLKDGTVTTLKLVKD